MRNQKKKAPMEKLKIIIESRGFEQLHQQQQGFTIEMESL